MDKREEMYAVILRGGEYSDSWTSVIAVSDDLDVGDVLLDAGDVGVA